MFRSIRWTLQMWHAAILATVLVAFGFVAFHLLRLTEFNRIDEDLSRMAFRVGASLRSGRAAERPAAGLPAARSWHRFSESRHGPEFRQVGRREAGLRPTAERRPVAAGSRAPSPLGGTFSAARSGRVGNRG